ncbi:MAG: phosphatidylserine/phosphatidylglycerophosphate/cardiolipin synthase family protein [Sphingomonas bacterium]|uniref:phospholipase D-like domain-containing protein n=1 Tax=Sphingomonas bacterium TaxID=1895847 RepID=UPI00260E670C|nr:phosphatidylserine/phosphatidylglycerophosphate/cardiolipin synthase family protein [Sphingomonas bacterium]MDB5694852.1 phosphatidylserine/phosphatidylglycerophosphate/cardiolipin synthase family protein [Sphingomonas bacterium]
MAPPPPPPAPQPSFTVDGNRLTLLDTGRRRLDALLALIDGAQRSLRLVYYLYADDDTGQQVNDALIRAARRGVSVALIVDGFGAGLRAPRSFFDQLEEAGVAMCWFLPRWGRRYLLRNHQKLALADEERIIVGGFNIEDDYVGRAESPELIWRDLGLVVEGPAAARMVGYFDALRAWSSQPKAKLRHLNRVLRRYSESQGSVRWLMGGPVKRLSPWARCLRADMRGARRIDIIAGYFAPSPTILRQLDRAGKRQAQVRIVSAALSDHPAAVEAARFTYAGLLRKKVRIFEYLPSKLHTKLYLVDDTTMIGSANFDMRSLFINLELMLRIDDAAFAAHMRTYVDGEIANSEAITPAVHRARTGWGRRVKQFVAYALLAVVDPTVSRRLNLG